MGSMVKRGDALRPVKAVCALHALSPSYRIIPRSDGQDD